MRRIVLSAVVAVFAALPGIASAAQFASVDRPGPPLDVSAKLLAASLRCSPGVDGATRAPVLLVPGTGVTADQEFSWNYEPALTKAGIAWCGVSFPDSGNDDMQINGEYVVYAIRTMFARAGRRIAIYGHSQGGEVPRWALRFWPDTRAMVDDVVGAAGPNHGSVVANAACGVRKPCQPSDWQAATTSHFIAALNSYQETFAGISYTEIYSHNDEEVQPNQNSLGTSSLHGGGGLITNVAVQDVCPNDTSEHLAVGSYDPVTWALLVDALTHDGPADTQRVGLIPCTQQFMPGVNPATFPADTARTVADLETSSSMELDGEGPLACYTTASCASSPAGAPRLRTVTSRCLRHRVLKFTLHSDHGDRVVSAEVYINGRRALRETGRRLTSIRVRARARRVTIRIVTVSKRHTRRTSTRRVTGCRQGRTKTVVTHHSPAARNGSVRHGRILSAVRRGQASADRPKLPPLELSV